MSPCLDLPGNVWCASGTVVVGLQLHFGDSIGEYVNTEFINKD